MSNSESPSISSWVYLRVLRQARLTYRKRLSGVTLCIRSLAFSNRSRYRSSLFRSSSSIFLRSVMSMIIPLRPTGFFSWIIGEEYMMMGNVEPSFLWAMYSLAPGFSPFKILATFPFALSRSSGISIWRIFVPLSKSSWE